MHINLYQRLKLFIEEWREWRNFQQLPDFQRRLVVYSEGAHDWPHLGPMLESFLKQFPEENVTYLSSDMKDPGLQFQHSNFLCFYIGSGTVRTFCFQFLKCRLLLLTLPDLELYFLKRSRIYPVHYVYCFHSINSTHTVYRSRAFAFFDTIFCVGPHHIKELRREEELNLAKRRNLVEHGSVKLDSLKNSYSQINLNKSPISKKIILLAPSWGDSSFAEDYYLIRLILKLILNKNQLCFLRLHPMTQRRCKKAISELRKEFHQEIKDEYLVIEEDLNNNNSLQTADILVSDWSGIATEFAFGFERPVIFINTRQKINNPNWEKFGLLGVEDTIRSEIGVVIETDQIDKLPALINNLIGCHAEFQKNISIARKSHIFNEGASAKVGARSLMSILNE